MYYAEEWLKNKTLKKEEETERQDYGQMGLLQLVEIVENLHYKRKYLERRSRT